MKILMLEEPFQSQQQYWKWGLSFHPKCEQSLGHNFLQNIPIGFDWLSMKYQSMDPIQQLRRIN
jgi:hypothetical protein